MTNDYIKYFNICRCRSCRYFMLMDPWAGDAICGLCYKVGVYKDIWGENHVCKAFVLDDSLRPLIGLCSESCSLYNSLGCPYLCMDNTGRACDEWTQN